MNQKIFIIIGSLDYGGAERHLSFIMPLLAAKGWNVTIVSLSPRVPLKPFFEKAGIKVIYPKDIHGPLARYLYLLKALGVLYKLYRHYPTALFHYFLPESYILGMTVALVARHKGPRVMSRRSLNYYQQKHVILGWLERFLHAFCPTLLANSRRVMADLIEKEKVPPSKVHLIYNGISVPHKPAQGSPILTFIHVANLIPYKGHKDLIQALGLIRHALPHEWRLWCVGQDTKNLQQDLEVLCDTLALKDHIHFLGARHDVETLWAQAHIGFLPSHEEGFSNAILEGMAAGLPMIVTDVGGNSDAVVHGITGLVVPPHDPAALGAAIIALLDPVKQRTMGKAGRQRILDHFTLEACVAAYDTLYTHLLKEKSCAA